MKLRVIDVNNHRLVDAPEDCIYVALSYVWGEIEQSRLTTQSRKGWGKRGALRKLALPRTIRNAIWLKRTLVKNMRSVGRGVLLDTPLFCTWRSWILLSTAVRSGLKCSTWSELKVDSIECESGFAFKLQLYSSKPKNTVNNPGRGKQDSRPRERPDKSQPANDQLGNPTRLGKTLLEPIDPHARLFASSVSGYPKWKGPRSSSKLSVMPAKAVKISSWLLKLRVEYASRAWYQSRLLLALSCPLK
jgi:hypothetical protein